MHEQEGGNSLVELLTMYGIGKTVHHVGFSCAVVSRWRTNELNVPFMDVRRHVIEIPGPLLLLQLVPFQSIITTVLYCTAGWWSGDTSLIHNIVLWLLMGTFANSG